MELSIIIPVFNESENIMPMFKRIELAIVGMWDKYPAVRDFELIYVNDGSTDTSLEVIRDLSSQQPNVGYINFSRNFGHQIAVTAGLDHANGNAVIIIDGDLQDPPELIPELYANWKAGFEVVYAQRTVRQGEGVFKKLTAKIFYKLITKITSVEIPVDTGDFRLIDQKIVKVLRNMPEKNKFLRGQIAWTGFRQIGVPYEREARHKGETGYPFRVMMRFALDGITAFSHLPLKIATWTGFMAFTFSIGMIVYALYSQFTGGTVQGWTSTIILVSFIGGLQLFCLGIIGEYIIRLITNIRNRPLYIVESTNVLPKHDVNVHNMDRLTKVEDPVAQ